MLIDWFTVGAQVLNFLVLIWLLKRFLYKPVLDAIDAREKRIALALADAAAQTEQARAEREQLARQRAAVEGERTAILERATGESREQHQRLLAAARAESAALRAEWQNALRIEQTRLGRDIASAVHQEVLAIARRVLGDLADVSLEERVEAVFAKRLREMPASAREPLEAALKSSSQATVRSAHVMSDPQRAAIQHTLEEVFCIPIRPLFETSPDPLCGVEFTVGGQKIAWSIADYLSTLDRQISALLTPSEVAASSRTTLVAPTP